MADQNIVEPGETGRPMSTADLANAAQSGTSNDSSVAAPPTGPASAPLLPEGETADLRKQWDAIQTAFVDEPRRAVEQADALVAGAMKRLAEVFASERAELESQWDRGDDVSTEDLRIALTRYRAFFGRLLSI